MKTNGKTAKPNKPFVPSGAPVAKSKNESIGKDKKPFKGFQVDNPNYSELDWLDGPAPNEPVLVPAPSQKPGAIRKVKLHGFSNVMEHNAPTDALNADFEAEEQKARERAAFGGEPKHEETQELNEIRYSPSLKIRTAPSVRMMPHEQVSEAGSSDAGKEAAWPEDIQEERIGESLYGSYFAAAKRGGSAAAVKERPSLQRTTFAGGSKLKQAGHELQHGAVPFDFKDRSRVDVIIRLEKPFQDAGYSLACSMDVPFCHAVVRAKLGAEAVVTLIRTQEEGNSKGRLDWIAAGRPAH
ncbi:WIAG-tail domain [Paenibacillus pasadenensis]|uniref:WIAG-tail domain n=1 Tax=Paenibacillus pasadenensis TaxID=217090 RepID=UPI0020412F89|nr:WIAG-tail domain [Paenibacillus pasadenensis]MCM3746880.1 WIAG-tail domain [Paenibacillus pasadenensis]